MVSKWLDFVDGLLGTEFGVEDTPEVVRSATVEVFGQNGELLAWEKAEYLSNGQSRSVMHQMTYQEEEEEV